MWIPFLFRFLLRTQLFRVIMERMTQPSVRCVAEVTVKIACCCVMAVMQGKKGWNKCSTCMIADGTAGLAGVRSTGTIWDVDCRLLVSWSSCGQTCIHMLIVQTSPWCDGSFSGHLAACVWRVLHTSGHWNRWSYLQVMKMLHGWTQKSGCLEGKNMYPLCLFERCMIYPSWLGTSSVQEKCLSFTVSWNFEVFSL